MGAWAHYADCKLPTCWGVMEKVNALLGWIRKGIFHRMGKYQFHYKNILNILNSRSRVLVSFLFRKEELNVKHSYIKE